MKKIILMANDIPGMKIAQHLNFCGDKIVRLYLHDDNAKYADEIIRESKCNKIFYSKDLKKENHHIDLKSENADFIITVYWAYLLKPKIFQSAADTVNFHPAFLPINRGWFPHVHSIIDGSKSGVTLHRIDEGADTGPIWAQEEIKISKFETAKDIYLRLQSEIVNLFKKKWDAIKKGSIIPFNQNESRAVYHKKIDIKNLDKLNLDEKIKVRDLINILRARTFGNLGFAYFEEEGERVYLNLKLSKDNIFKN